MDLIRQLTCFIAVAEERHFGRAAERLQIAQPPLSQQIRRLEAQLGTELLVRTTRRVDLTDAGAVYLERARAILAAIDSAAVQARRVAAGLIGHVAIGCVGSVTYSLLPALSRRLTDELPGVDFSFRGEMLAAEQVTALREREIDIALLRPPVADRGLTAISLRRDLLLVALPSGHPLAARTQLRMRDLAEADFIVHSALRRARMYDVVGQLSLDAGFSPHVRHEVGETSTLITLVAGGRGIAIMPDPVRALRLDGVSYVPLDGPSTTIELVLAQRRDDTRSHLERTVAVLRDLVAGEAVAG